MSFLGTVPTATQGGNGLAAPSFSDVIGFNNNGTTQPIGPTNGTQLPVADPVLANAQTNDAPISVFVSGDPAGDFAGINLLEQVMTDGTGLAINTRSLNQQTLKTDASNALIPSDAPAALEIELINGGQYILDTTGYQTILIQQQTLGSYVFLDQSNDNVNFTPASAVQLLGNQQSFPSPYTQAVFSQAMYAIPVAARYIRFTATTTTTVDLAIYLRQIPFNSYQTYFSVNLPQGAQLGGYNQTINPNGTANAAFNAQGGTAPNPTLISGIDQTSAIRAVKTDGVGMQYVRGAPTQVGQQSIEELLTQILGTLRVLTHYKYEEQLMAGIRSSADEPDNMLADYLNPASTLNNMTN